MCYSALVAVGRNAVDVKGKDFFYSIHWRRCLYSALVGSDIPTSEMVLRASVGMILANQKIQESEEPLNQTNAQMLSYSWNFFYPSLVKFC